MQKKSRIQKKEVDRFAAYWEAVIKVGMEKHDIPYQLEGKLIEYAKALVEKKNTDIVKVVDAVCIILKRKVKKEFCSKLKKAKK